MAEIESDIGITKQKREIKKKQRPKFQKQV